MIEVLEEILNKFVPPRVFPIGWAHTEKMIAELAPAAAAFRIVVLNMVYRRGSGHIGGAFSVAEILTALYFHHLRIDPQDSLAADRDRLLLAKGHACAMLYTVLAYRGYFPTEELWSFRGIDSRLQGHPERRALPGLDAPAGPLGHRIAVGAGMALAAGSDHSRRRIFVVLGDGEINAGVVWEGALVASKYGLDNLTAVLDYTGVQQTGPTAEVLPTDPVVDKWRSFGWHVLEVNGHKISQLLDVLDEAEEIHGRPIIIVAHTIKGKGVSFMESNHYWHGGVPREDQLQAEYSRWE